MGEQFHDRISDCIASLFFSDEVETKEKQKLQPVKESQDVAASVGGGEDADMASSEAGFS